MSSRFKVDLRGVVDLLSHHLYSSPRVYVRELLQNSVDAITARRDVDDQGSRTIVLTPSPDEHGTMLRIEDDGVGLLPDEVEMFLSTVGSSSKRDELGSTGQDLLGQFGIGPLSAFMVSDEIRVITRSAPQPHAASILSGFGGGDAAETEDTRARILVAYDHPGEAGAAAVAAEQGFAAIGAHRDAVFSADFLADVARDQMNDPGRADQADARAREHARRSEDPALIAAYDAE